MNWNEFLRTMTWCISSLAVVVGVPLGVFAPESKYKTLMIVAAVICVFIAILGFSVIGGMNWGPAQ